MKDEEPPRTPLPIFGVDYVWENGLLVFTARYLLKRGECCKTGCRNCPYGFLKEKSPSAER